MAKTRKPSDTRREPVTPPRQPDEQERRTDVDRPGKPQINRDEDRRRQDHQRQRESEP
ncbi:MAG: hypothetical protein JNM18_19110 [Planctomycetaceae bacterium]|nr:hypothetical protein [Planctomycetaceae bacterium]